MTDNGFATRDTFFQGAAVERRYASYEIPLLGEVRIQSLTELERSTYEASCLDETGRWTRESGAAAKVKLIILCCVDGDGNRLFIDSDSPQIERLDSYATDRLYDACVAHCGFSKADIEVMAKNSDGTLSECSP